ncbi:MAG: hydrogenase small subunit [Bacillota bacterium]
MQQQEFISLCRQHSLAQNQDEYSLSQQVLEAVGQYQSHNSTKLPVIWLETNDSGDNNISLMNTTYPYLDRVFTELIDLLYSNTFMAAQGADAVKILKNAVNRKAAQFTLVVEGAIPLQKGYNVVFTTKQGDVSALEAVEWLGGLAKYVVAIGTCASFGGPTAARPNPSHSVAVSEVLDCEVINVSGCPVNPDWFVGTLAHLLMYGRPELDDHNRPTLFYGFTIHRHCQRRSYFDNGNFAASLGDRECMFSLGCVGPKTAADCPYRQWINVNWPVEANTPCIGCTNPDFPDGSTPFFTSLPDKRKSSNEKEQ